jgi:HEAT repeat protein
MTDRQINKYLRQLYDDDQETRIDAIDRLGEIGDELCLKELREQMKYISKEHHALIIAVGKL